MGFFPGTQLAVGIARPLSMLFHLFWESGEVAVDWKLANIVPVFQKRKKGDRGNYRAVSLSLVPGRMMEKILLGVTDQHLKDSVVMGHSQQPFMKEMNYLTNFSSFFDKLTHLVYQRKALTVTFLDLCTTLFHTLCFFFTQYPAHN